MTDLDIVKVFRSTVCPHCKKTKQEATGFCNRCYRSLPKPMQRALWQRFGEGFEEAFRYAHMHLFKEKLALDEANGVVSMFGESRQK